MNNSQKLDPEKIVLSGFYLCISYFSGFAVMVVELAGAKLLAPLFGNTLYTWSTLIGVVLIALSVGNAIGGWLADRPGAVKNLHIALFIAALATLLVPTLGLLVSISVKDMDSLQGAFIFTSVLFVVPATVFGLMSPIALRLMSKLSNDKRVGLVGGFISGSSAIGSVMGTFATGLFLMDHVGVKEIYYITAGLIAIVLIISMILHKEFPRVRTMVATSTVAIFIVCMVIILKYNPSPSELHTKLSYYHELRIVEKQNEDTGGTVRYMFLDGANHGSIDVSSKEANDYWQRTWRLLELQSPRFNINNALFVGGGTYGVPQLLSKHWPEADITVVEIDQNVTDAAKEWFYLDNHPAINVVTADARWHINQTSDKYELIYLDAFKGRSIPTHLVTHEFFTSVKLKLNPGGIGMINIVGKISGDDTAFFDSILNTISSVFTDVQIYSQTHPQSEGKLTNIFVLFGDKLTSKSMMKPTDQETTKLLDYHVDISTLMERESILITDNYQPVDRMMSKMLRSE